MDLRSMPGPPHSRGSRLATGAAAPPISYSASSLRRPARRGGELFAKPRSERRGHDRDLQDPQPRSRMPIGDHARHWRAENRPEVRVRIFQVRRPIDERVQQQARREELPRSVSSPQEPRAEDEKDRDRVEGVEQRLPSGLEVSLAEYPLDRLVANVGLEKEEREHR